MTRYEIPRLHGPTLKVRFVGGCSMKHLKIVFRYDIEKEARKEENLIANGWYDEEEADTARSAEWTIK